AAALMLVLGAASGAAGAAHAQAAITLTVPTLANSDTISPAPSISITATPGAPELAPFTTQLEVALDAQFSRTFFVRSSPSLEPRFQLDSLLPERRMAFFRARLFNRFGDVVAQVTFSSPVATWLTLLTATRPTNVLFTRTPTFQWNSPAITLPPGPWRYTL